MLIWRLHCRTSRFTWKELWIWNCKSSGNSPWLHVITIRPIFEQIQHLNKFRAMFCLLTQVWCYFFVRKKTSRVPWSKVAILGNWGWSSHLLIGILIMGPYKPLRNWVDFSHPLLYGNSGSWSTLAHVKVSPRHFEAQDLSETGIHLPDQGIQSISVKYWSYSWDKLLKCKQMDMTCKCTSERW